MGNLVKSVEEIAWEICDGITVPAWGGVPHFDFNEAMFECETIDMRVFVRERTAFILVQHRVGSGYLIGLLGCKSAEWRDGSLDTLGTFTRVEVGPARFSVSAERDGGIEMELPGAGAPVITAEFHTLVIRELEGFRDDAPPDYTSDSGTLIRSESLNWGTEVEVLRAWTMSRREDGACGAAGGAGGLEVAMRRAEPTWPRRYRIRISDSDGTILISKTSANPMKAMSPYLGRAEAELLQQEADALLSVGSEDYAWLRFFR